MQPITVQYNVIAGNATTIVNAAAGPATATFTLATAVVGTAGQQQRLLITSGGNDSSIFFRIVGLNQAGFTVSEFLKGPNTSTTQSALDYATIISITPSGSSTSQTVGTTASTVSVGQSGAGSTLWYIVDQFISPFNLEYGCVLQTGAATWSIQYTYDDPNNLLPGVTVPQAFNHPTIVNATATIDGSSNDPITAWRLLISAGTGTVRATGVQAGWP